jgi:N,N'-diacetyllegionaminate synthase
MTGRAELIAEIATSHGGDVDLACDMIAAARDAGADTVKFQTYSLERLNPTDPQAEWLKQAHLDKAAHERLFEHATNCGLFFLSTPFDYASLQMLRDLGLTRFKIASSESGNDWWRPDLRTAPLVRESWCVSYPWGVLTPHMNPIPSARLTAIPLYPTPLECIGRVELLDGYSDHCEGIDACLYMLAKGAKVIETHFCLPGKSRVKSFDKDPSQFRQIRRFAESVATMTSGVSETFRTRWSA